MIYKIGNVCDMNTLPPMDFDLFVLLHNYASVLTNVYGVNRDVDHDDGGCVFYAEKGTTAEHLKSHFDYTKHTLEYANTFENDIVSVTYLLHNEYVVILVMAIDDLPEEIKKEI